MDERTPGPPPAIRAAFDTNVIISVLLFSGPPSQFVSAWQSSRLGPVVSALSCSDYHERQGPDAVGGLSIRETFWAFGEIQTRLHVRRGPDAMGCRRGSAFRKSSLSIVASWDLKKTPDPFVSTHLFSVYVKFPGHDFTDFGD